MPTPGRGPGPEGLKAAIAKLPIIETPALDPVKISRSANRYPVRDLKSVYRGDNKAIRADDNQKFADAIKNFSTSGNDALSNNRLKRNGLSKELQDKLVASAGKRITKDEGALASLRDELLTSKIVPFEPNE